MSKLILIPLGILLGASLAVVLCPRIMSYVKTKIYIENPIKGSRPDSSSGTSSTGFFISPQKYKKINTKH